jgi:hypothetical protein
MLRMKGRGVFAMRLANLTKVVSKRNNESAKTQKKRERERLLSFKIFQK